MHEYAAALLVLQIIASYIGFFLLFSAVTLEVCAILFSYHP